MPLNPSLAELLAPAFRCPEFDGACQHEMRWIPEAGHVPRGFTGAAGQLEEVELVLVFAEPGDPHPGEAHAGLQDAHEYALATVRDGVDLFHRKVRQVLDLCWPELTLDQQLHKVWLTDSVLCSAQRECGPVSRSAARACAQRYLIPQLNLFPNALVVAMGGKAATRMRAAGVTDFMSAYAAAPPGCNYRKARPSWRRVARELARRRRIRAIVREADERFDVRGSTLATLVRNCLDHGQGTCAQLRDELAAQVPPAVFDLVEARLPQPTPALQASWDRAWRAVGRSGDAATLMELLARYGEGHRAYHSMQHLSECIATLEPVLHRAEHPGEVELALWFHDAIYDVRANDNEERSARWAQRALLAAGAPDDVAARVHDLVLATRHAALPQRADEKLLVDVDLAILGASPERFDEYERQVRQEYAWVPEHVFRDKRLLVLQQFLERPCIFSTERFRAEREAAARENLARAIARLS